MGGKKISELPESTDIYDGCCFAVVTNGQTRKVTYAVLKSQIEAELSSQFDVKMNDLLETVRGLINGGSSTEPPPSQNNYYGVSFSLDDVSADNEALRVLEGSAYTLTLSSQRNITTVKVIMNGADVTHNVVNRLSDNQVFIDIKSVTGDIKITAVATEPQVIYRTVQLDLENVESSNETPSPVLDGSSYSVTLNIMKPSKRKSFSVLMGGINITNQVSYFELEPTSKIAERIVVNIGYVTGDIEITAAASGVVVNQFSVELNLENMTSSNTSQFVEENKPYQTALTVNDGYEFGSCYVTMGGRNITSGVTSFNDDVISVNVPAVTGAIEINASATAKSPSQVEFSMTVDENGNATTEPNVNISVDENGNGTFEHPMFKISVDGFGNGEIYV